MKSCSWSTMAFWMPMMMCEKAMVRAMGTRSASSCEIGREVRRQSCAAATVPQESRRPQAARDLVELAVESGLFNRLVEALNQADLVDTLRGEGPFTVFAPSDEAFSKLPKKTLDAALQDPEALRAILTYHVVPGRYTSDMLEGIDALKTIQGSPLKIDTSLGVRAGAAQVVKADVEARNGVIHVIDTVLLPE